MPHLPRNYFGRFGNSDIINIGHVADYEKGSNM
jgi:hypothetical protein